MRFMNNAIEKEHKKLTESIIMLFTQFEKLPNSIRIREEIGYSEHNNYINWINNQIISLNDAFNLLNNNSYKSVFTIIRAIFESYWIINLTMNGLKYSINRSAKKGHDIQKIYQKWIKDFNKNKEQGIKQGILEIKPPKKNKIKVIYEGIKFNKGELIPRYYFLFREYDPVIVHIGREEPYFKTENLPKVNDELIKKHKNLKKHFSFGGGIKESLLLNKLITEKQFERAKVHYNFLSMWTHPSIKSIEMIEKNVKGTGKFDEISKYDFFLTRLALLYIGNLLVLFLQSFLKFSKRQIKEKKIKSLNYEQDFRKAIKEFEDLTTYFWFIYNKPHFYYKWRYAYKLLTRKEKRIEELEKLDINSLDDDDEIEYYTDPLETLKNLSTSMENRILGEYMDCTPDNVQVVKKHCIKSVCGCNHEKKKKIHTRFQAIGSA